MSSRFKVGDRVKVRVGSPPGHFRTPTYVQGKLGAVERVHGDYRNPESLAHGGDGLPKQPLYLVRFPGGPAMGEARRIIREIMMEGDLMLLSDFSLDVSLLEEPDVRALLEELRREPEAPAPAAGREVTAQGAEWWEGYGWVGGQAGWEKRRVKERMNELVRRDRRLRL